MDAVNREHRNDFLEHKCENCRYPITGKLNINNRFFIFLNNLSASEFVSFWPAEIPFTRLCHF